MRLDYFFRHSERPKTTRWGPKLQLAAYFNIPWLVAQYLRENHDPTWNTGGGCALIWCSETGSYKCIEILLLAGAEANQVEYDGWSPLHWAAANGHSRVCGLLIEHGADREAEDDRGYTPKDMAVKMGHYNIAKAYFGRIEDSKLWTPSVDSRVISKIGARDVFMLPEDWITRHS